MKYVFYIMLALTACAPSKDGIQGPKGDKGEVGIPGIPGAPGTEVTVVQFCNAATIYPTSFPEYGFCIDGHLYGTYWDGKNAWTAEIVPGLYHSTATGLGCTFAVTNGCTVAN